MYVKKVNCAKESPVARWQEEHAMSYFTGWSS